MTQYQKDPEQLELDLNNDSIFDAHHQLMRSHIVSASQYPPSKGIINRNIVDSYDINKWIAEVEDLCEQYPALEKAYKNFEMLLGLLKQEGQR